MYLSPEATAETLTGYEDAGGYEDVADAAAARLRELTTEATGYLDQLHGMGVVETTLEEVDVEDGSHRLLVLDETVQPGGAFKYNGAAYWMLRTAEETDVETVYTFSAGNAGLSVATAASSMDRKAVVFGPKDMSEAKEEANKAVGADVDKSSDSVMDAKPSATAAAEADAHGELFHPFNDPYGVGGQGLVAERLVQGLHERHAEGDLDLYNDPVDILVQRGGGSLIGGIAAAVRAEKAARRMGDNVRVVQVRPEEDEAGNPNRFFDGLAVRDPGDLTAPVINDERYVDDTVHVTERAAGKAAIRLFEARGVRYEPSGLAGVAAYETMSPVDERPNTTYVTVLSGANVTDARAKELVALGTSIQGNSQTNVASGPSHEHTRGPVVPLAQRQQNGPATEGEAAAQQAYREQLEEMGIYLAS